MTRVGLQRYGEKKKKKKKDFSPLNSSALVTDQKVAHFSALNTRTQDGCDRAGKDMRSVSGANFE